MWKTLTAIALAAGLAGAAAYAHEAESTAPNEGGMMGGDMPGMMTMMSEMRDMMETCNRMMSAAMEEHGAEEAPTKQGTQN